MNKINKIISNNVEYDSWVTKTEVSDMLSEGNAALGKEISEGKVAIAEALTNKSVPTLPTEPFARMKDNIDNISQEVFVIDGGDMYEKQLFGDGGAVYNMYDVLFSLLSNGNFSKYNAILLGEYFKGYSSIELKNADAYYTSDGYLYESQTIHYWNDTNSGKGNRWVAYLFIKGHSEGGANYTVPDTDLCPRSIYIGRDFGQLICPVAGRISKVVVPDGNSLYEIRNAGAQNWDEQPVINNIARHSVNFILYNSTAVNATVIDIETLDDSYPIANCINLAGVSFPRLKTINSGQIFTNCNNVCVLDVPSLETINGGWLADAGGNTKLTKIYLPSLKTINGGWLAYRIARLTDISAPIFETITNNGRFMEAQNLVTTLSLPSFKNLNVNNNGAIAWNCTGLTSASFPALTETDGTGYLLYGCSNVTNLDVHSLEEMNGDCIAYNCPKITEINTPNLRVLRNGTLAYNSTMSTTPLTVNLDSLEEVVINANSPLTNILNNVTLTNEEIDLDKLTSVNMNTTYYNARQLFKNVYGLKILKLNSVNNISSVGAPHKNIVSNCYDLERFEMKNSDIVGGFTIDACPKLRYAIFGTPVTWQTDYDIHQIFYNANPNVCHLEFGANGQEQEVDMWLESWNPTNAMNTSRTDLIEDNTLCVNNMQQFLYNFREYIVKRCATVPTNKTIHLLAAVKNNITGNYAKGWTVPGESETYYNTLMAELESRNWSIA